MGLSYRHIKRKRGGVAQEEKEVHEDEIAGDLENGHQHPPPRRANRDRRLASSMKKVRSVKKALSKSFGSSNDDLEGVETGVETGVPMGTDDDHRRRKSHDMMHQKSSAKPAKRTGDEDSSSSSDSDSDSSSDDSSSDESEEVKAIDRSKSSRKKSTKYAGDERHKGDKTHHREDSTAADSLAVVAADKRERRLSKAQSERINSALDKEALDEKKARELKACMSDRSLSRDERRHKMDEIKARYSSKNVHHTAKSERFHSSLEHIEEGKHSKEYGRRHTDEHRGDRPPMPPSKSKRRTVDGSHRDIGHSPGKSRRNLDNDRKHSGESRRRSVEESSGRKSKDRHKSSRESNSSESSEDRLLSSHSSRNSRGEGKHSSEKSRHRPSDDHHREEKRRERKSNGSSPNKREPRKSSGKSKRKTDSPEDHDDRPEEPLPERRHSRKKDGEKSSSDRDRNGDRRKSSSKKHDSHDEKMHSKRPSSRRKPQ